MSMTRNDFELLARHLGAMYPNGPDHDNPDNYNYRAGYVTAIHQVMGACSSVNARFNSDTFMQAIKDKADER